MGNEDALFLSVQPLVWQVVHAWCRRSANLDHNEVFGDCMPSVIRAIRTYDPKQGALTTYVYRHVTNHLMAYSCLRRWRARHSKKQVIPNGARLMSLEEMFHRAVVLGVPDSHIHHLIRNLKQEPFNVDEMIEGLSPRARWLVHVALKWGLRKSRLIKKLRDEFAWEAGEVKRVFAEIREALQ